MLTADPRTFYDEYPFDWTERYRPDELARIISPVLLRLLDRLPPDVFVLDVGCGPGRVMTYLAYRQIRAVGVDRSLVSVRLLRQRCPLPGIVADNLALPLADGCADLVISDGVLHHIESPEQAFSELCRVLRSRGILFLAVYRPGGHYEWLYCFPGGLFRRAVRYRTSRALMHATALPSTTWHTGCVHPAGVLGGAYATCSTTTSSRRVFISSITTQFRSGATTVGFGSPNFTLGPVETCRSLFWKNHDRNRQATSPEHRCASRLLNGWAPSADPAL